MIQLPIEIGDIIRVGRFKNKRITVKDISVDENGLPLINGRGILKIRIEKLLPKKENIMKKKLKEFHEKGIPVQIKEQDGKFWLFLIDGEHEKNLSNIGFDTKESAIHAAFMKGFRIVDGKGKDVDIKQDNMPETVKPPKLTKSEPIKYEKPKEMKESYLNRARKIIREQLKKELREADVTDTELEAKARRFAEIAQRMKLLQEELKNLSAEHEELDGIFRPLLEAAGNFKGTFIRAGKLLIMIEREGYNRTSKSYKTGFDYLYKKVNATMKELADEALKLTKTASYVKSKISVVEEGKKLNEESWFSKIKNSVSNMIKKIFGLNNKANKELDELESMIN